MPFSLSDYFQKQGLRVVETAELRRSRLDVPARQRPVVVERRPVGDGVLLEGELERGLRLRLAVQAGEGAEAVALQRLVELRRAKAHNFPYASRASSPLWQTMET